MRRRSLLSLCLMGSLAACGGSDGPGGPSGPAPVASIILAAPPQALAAFGETAQLSAVAKDARGGTVSGVAFSWTSSAPNVATVAGGTITAVGNGTSTITVTGNAVSATVQVTVQQRVAQLAVAFTADTLGALGDTARANASAQDGRGNAMTATATITWLSSNPSVVTVDATGLLTALAEGSASIRATHETSTGERTVHVRQRAARLAITRQPADARAGLEFATSPELEVQDARGNRIDTDNTTTVTATIETDDGSITAGGTAVAALGIVRFPALAVGGRAGQKTLRFSAPDMSTVNSEAFALAAGDPTAITVAGGNSQTAPAATVLPQPLQAGVHDGWDNPVPSVTVSFAVTQGDGTLGNASAVSDQHGNASATYTLPRHAGTSVIRATSAVSETPAEFTVIATPNGIIRGTIGAAPPAAAARAASTRNLERAPARSASAHAQPAFRDIALDGEAVSGELLVIYHPDRIGAPEIGSMSFRQASVTLAVNAAMRAALTPLVDEQVVTMASLSPGILTARVRVAAGTTEADAIARLRRDPRVRAVERNSIMRSTYVPPTAIQSYLAGQGLSGVPLMPLASLTARTFRAAQVAMYPGGGVIPDGLMFASQSWHYTMAGLPRAWEITRGSADLLVAVVDDGTRFDHPAMAGLLTSDGYDFVSLGGPVSLCAGGTTTAAGDGDGYDPDPTSPDFRSVNSAGTCLLGSSSNGGHGLHVAGTIAVAADNALGLVGVNAQVRIRPVRSFGVWGAGTTYDIAQGILYAAGLPADNGAGGTVTAAGGPARIINMSFGGNAASVVRLNAVQQAAAAGALLIASAGNNNNATPNYPAAYAEVISVTALGPTGQLASYSSFGSTVNIAAPGGEVRDGSSHGVLSAAWNFTNGTPTTGSWNGTSMATPHVTGVAALVLAANPTFTAAQVRARLIDFAVDMGAPGWDQIYGSGLVNARNAITGTMGPARTRHVRLVHAATGAVVRTGAAAGNGAYEFAGLDDGTYWVFAGEDDSGDGFLGLPGRWWSAFGTVVAPATITIDGAAVHQANIAALSSTEVEPNNTPETANELVVDGHVNGVLSSTADNDYYRLRIADAGTYALLVTGQAGACGYSIEANPVLTLYSTAGATLETNSDIDAAAFNFCAGITRQLTAGTYILRVQGAPAGRYVISARRQ